MTRKQEGFTMIELLASLTIVSIIGVIIWGVFFQSYNYSQKSATKNSIQQEANIILLSLKKIHQTSMEYTINSSACSITVASTKNDGTTKNYIFNDTDLCISVDKSDTINPSNNDLPVTLTIYQKSNSSNRLEISTILYRLKDGGI